MREDSLLCTRGLDDKPNRSDQAPAADRPSEKVCRITLRPRLAGCGRGQCGSAKHLKLWSGRVVSFGPQIIAGVVAPPEDYFLSVPKYPIKEKDTIP